MPKDVDLEHIRQLVELVEKHNLAEITVEENGVTITIKGVATEGHQAVTHPTDFAVPYKSLHQNTPTHHANPDESADTSLIRIESPMIGVFYRAPSPDSPPFIDIDDTIEIGQTIGVIEAMKVFNEVPAEIAGVVVDIPAENGKLIQQGETLVVIRPPHE